MKKRSAARILAAAVVMGVGLALTACGSSGGSSGEVASGDYSGPKVTVTFWNGWTGGAAPVLVPKLVDKFNSEHKNIVVKDVPMEWADLAKKMPLAVKAGKGPDVAVAHGDDIATYAAQGLLLKSDSIVKSLGYSASDFPEGLMKAGEYKGAQYGIPWSVTPLGLYVNKDVLSQAGIDPTTIPADKASYMDALAKLKTAGIQGEWVDGYVFTGTFEFESLLWQFGGDLFNDDVTKATFNSDAGVQALTHMVDLIKEGYSPANVAQDGNINALIAGKTAFNWNGVWQTTNTAFDKLAWTAVAVPQIGTEKAVWSSSTHWMFMNNKGQDKNKTAAAATFVKWMNDNSASWPDTGELPASNTVRNDPALVQKYPNLKPFLDELPYAHYETSAPGITSVTATVTTAVNEAVTGKKSPKQALDDAVEKANTLLKQNQQTYGE
ncbi:ABC transporter substrate-binding protein [Leifsonia aquatica]|jgi:multiple sugar transport system substrate-binding protein|uniref:ABC transporter, solute-binding protein n=2 Tax=Leifsonia aquatica TaxID=144185 RepID=U2R1T0_LEIAQ|nr:ABC transporter substrate-binding protein [Leifsonia aquatica]ERK69240.1 ABC transporter, solute-binding protein [Leifsonia aquatica ATCC 14665]MBB2965751.1 multiple sugar transport system substrate-binding protein [Leifsonia aquatica]